MKSMQIFYCDLTIDAKREFDDTFGPPDMFNHSTMPIAIVDHEEFEDDDNG